MANTTVRASSFSSAIEAAPVCPARSSQLGEVKYQLRNWMLGVVLTPHQCGSRRDINTLHLNGRHG